MSSLYKVKLQLRLCRSFTCSMYSYADQLKGRETPSAKSSATQDKSTKLFEKEEDNQYSEMLLTVQLAAVALNGWSQHVCKGRLGEASWPSSIQGAVRHVQSVLIETFRSLQTTCETFLADTGMGPVSGMRMSGPSNDVSSFATVYRLALTIIAFAPFRLRCDHSQSLCPTTALLYSIVALGDGTM